MDDGAHKSGDVISNRVFVRFRHVREDSVKSELMSAKNWSLNWGELYNKGGGVTYQERIAAAEKEKSE